MGRPPTRNRFKTERRHLAELIDAAMKSGRRGDRSPDETPMPWTDSELRRALGIGHNTDVGDWHKPEVAARPLDIVSLLRVFYGTWPTYRQERHAMHIAWKRAGGIDDEDQPEPAVVETKMLDRIAEFVVFTVNRPVPDNQRPDTQRIPLDLRMRVDEGLTTRTVVDGDPVSAVVDIGVTKAIFGMESAHWLPAHDSFLRDRRDRPTFVRGPVSDSVEIVGPTDHRQRLIDYPLGDETMLVVESRNRGEGPLTLSVKVPVDGFDIAIRGAPPLRPATQDIVAALIAQLSPPDDHARIEIAREIVTPNPSKVSQ